MRSDQLKVRRFHELFSIPVRDYPSIPPRKERELRVELIGEEFDEFQMASEHCDIVGVADALADLLYVVLGAACAWGLDMEPIFDAVHESNMTKVGGRKSETGKLLKPDNYSPPRIDEIIKKQRDG